MHAQTTQQEPARWQCIIPLASCFVKAHPFGWGNFDANPIHQPHGWQLSHVLPPCFFARHLVLLYTLCAVLLDTRPPSHQHLAVRTNGFRYMEALVTHQLEPRCALPRAIANIQNKYRSIVHTEPFQPSQWQLSNHCSDGNHQRTAALR